MHAIEHSKEEYLDSTGDLHLGGHLLSKRKPPASDMEAKNQQLLPNGLNGLDPEHKCPEPCPGVDETSMYLIIFNISYFFI